jgi:predicted ATPase
MSTEDAEPRNVLPEDFFVGRDAEFRVIATRIQRAVAGVGSLCAISGEAGVGKTRLISEALRTIGPDQALVLQSRCIDPSKAFHAWVDLFREYGRRFGWESARKVAGGHVRHLAKLEPDILVGTEEEDLLMPAEANMLSEVDERRALEALRAFFLCVNRHKPLVIRIEDVQSADRWTLNLIDLISRDLDRSSVCLICELRSNEGPIDRRLETHFETARRKGVLERIHLQRFEV